MKKNIFKKLGGAFLGLALGLGVVAGISSASKVSEVKAASGDEYTFTSTSGTSTDAMWSFSTDKNGGSNDPAISSAQLRLYPKNKITFTGASGVTINSASFSCVVNANSKGKVPTGWSADAGSIDSFSSDLTSFEVSTISKNSFSITIGEGGAGNVGLKTVKIAYSGGGTTTNYTVTFDANGHGSAPAAVTVASGSKVSEPTAPTASGYTFGGWYREAGCTNAYDFNAAVTGSFTLYAKWTENGGGGGGDEITKITKLADIESGKQYWIGATTDSSDYYFKADLSAAGTGISGTSTTSTSDAAVVTIAKVGSNYTIAVGEGLYLSLATGKANGKVDVVSSAAEWTFEEADSLISMKINSHYLMKNSSGSLNFGSYASGQANVWLVKAPEVVTKSLVSISTVTADVSAMTGDTAWTIGGASATGVLSDSTAVVDVTKYVDFSVTQSVPTITEDGTMSVTLVAKGKDNQTITKSATVTATLSLYNPLKAIYSMASNAPVDVYGMFVGNKDGNNIIIMDGAYGMDIYKSGCGTNDYVAGETVLHVVGKVSIYNGLYEIAATSISKDTEHTVGEPVTYSTKGGETADYASRLTTVTGVPSVTKGSITGTAGSADITLSFKVSETSSVQVFYKKATQTTDDMATIKGFIDSESEMTVAGFTAWYNGFQVQMTGVIKADESYTAEIFAQDLLDQTDAICASYDGVTDNGAALISVWNDLQSNDKYPKLPSAEKSALQNATADESGSVVEQAMARYDYLVAKYGLSSFIDGRSVSPARTIGYVNHDNNSSTTIIIVVSVVSLTTLAALLVIKRRKAIEK